jgi:hypothetical protein
MEEEGEDLYSFAKKLKEFILRSTPKELFG